MSGDSAPGGRETGILNRGDGKEPGNNGTAERTESDVVGTEDEQHQKRSGGDRSSGNRLHINIKIIGRCWMVLKQNVERENKYYDIRTATEMKLFFEENKELFKSEPICEIRYAGDVSKQPGEFFCDTEISFVFHTFVLQMNFFYHSECFMDILTDEYTIDGSKVRKTPVIDNEKTNFIFSKEESNLKEVLFDRHIIGVEIGKTNQEVLADPTNDCVRPQGGDYFITVAFLLEDCDYKLLICGDSESDGYMNACITPKETYLRKYISYSISDFETILF